MKVILYPRGGDPIGKPERGANKYMYVLFRRGIFKVTELVCKSENALVTAAGVAWAEGDSDAPELGSDVSLCGAPNPTALLGFDKIEIQEV